MRLTPLAFILGVICCAAPGCGLLGNAVRTIVVEPVHYCACSDEYFSNHRHRRLAEDAWRQVARTHPSLSYAPDYGLGFRDGFTDYLDAGPGNVPPLPPRHYWKSRFQTPAGHQAILDWYEGFSHGAQAAAATGYREYVTLPSFLSRSAAPEHHHGSVVGPATAELIPTPLPEADIDDARHLVVPTPESRGHDVPPLPQTWEGID